MEIETISKLKCNRCGHEWFPQSTKLPKACAKCNSPYWNKKRVRPIKEVKVKC